MAALAEADLERLPRVARLNERGRAVGLGELCRRLADIPGLARIRYTIYGRRSGWEFDYPTMERNLMLMMREVTSLRAHVDEREGADDLEDALGLHRATRSHVVLVGNVANHLLDEIFELVPPYSSSTTAICARPFRRSSITRSARRESGTKIASRIARRRSSGSDARWRSRSFATNTPTTLSRFPS